MAEEKTKRNRSKGSNVNYALYFTRPQSIPISSSPSPLLLLFGIFALMFFNNPCCFFFVHPYWMNKQTSVCKYEFKVLNYDLRFVYPCVSVFSFSFLSVFLFFVSHLQLQYFSWKYVTVLKNPHHGSVIDISILYCILILNKWKMSWRSLFSLYIIQLSKQWAKVIFHWCFVVFTAASVAVCFCYCCWKIG